MICPFDTTVQVKRWYYVLRFWRRLYANVAMVGSFSDALQVLCKLPRNSWSACIFRVENGTLDLDSSWMRGLTCPLKNIIVFFGEAYRQLFIGHTFFCFCNSILDRAGQNIFPLLCFFFLIWKLMPLVIQLKYCPVLPSLNKVDYYYYYYYYYY